MEIDTRSASMLAEPLIPRGTGRASLNWRALVFVLISSAALAVVVFWPMTVTALTQIPVEVLARQRGGDSYWHGVSLGGWLVMEINPSKRSPGAPPDVRPRWMFDQIEAQSELDFVTSLRRSASDDVAIRTMRNHWEGYITDGALDAAAALGVNAVRVPVGYWIVDPPVGGNGSALEYGFTPEGFVSGGLNYLRRLLPKLRERGIVALIDMHALPCNSACVSDGLSCASPLAFSDARVRTQAGLPRCGGGGGGGGSGSSGSRSANGSYATSRDATRGGWGGVAVAAVGALAQWVSSLPAADAAVVVALQLANEPALNSHGYNDAVQAFYAAAAPAARQHLPTLPLVVSFIPPNDVGAPSFVARLRRSAGEILADQHWYLNWHSAPGVQETWRDIHEQACTEPPESWLPYTRAGVPVILGEWSLATNHDAPRDLSDAATAAELKRLWREQREVFRADGIVGAFFWTLRMGSGWDPRPTADAPRGRHVDGSGEARSLDGYPYQVWSLLELAAHGIAGRLDGPTGAACARGV